MSFFSCFCEFPSGIKSSLDAFKLSTVSLKVGFYKSSKNVAGILCEIKDPNSGLFCPKLKHSIEKENI